MREETYDPIRVPRHAGSQFDSPMGSRIDIPPGIPGEFENLYSVVERNRELVTDLIDRLSPIIKHTEEANVRSDDKDPGRVSSSNVAHNISSQAQIIASQNHRLMELLQAIDL